MVSFDYTIKDEQGIHARPAGLLVKEAAKLSSTVKIEKAGKTVEARKLLALMGLGVKCGETITVTVDGENESADAETVKAFLEANL